ncbi:hypothetical protein HELRODRAFT_169863 [Helobdella robusta]|uniref:Ig-like domain-containing protein n=1 Tax=Helobdella robusta TaxID=6412 RepID=T1F2E0_HELRO|nr:hypothetical protein HELRODRAFT_169863 [Helobdella robusta]ESO08127.1 hypothetical protein HELRODRAFT_169863 [Helobdella robusta]
MAFGVLLSSEVKLELAVLKQEQPNNKDNNNNNNNYNNNNNSNNKQSVKILEATQGSNLVIKCPAVISRPPPSYSITFNNASLRLIDRHVLTSFGLFQILKVDSSDEGVYRCVASNNVSSSSLTLEPAFQLAIVKQDRHRDGQRRTVTDRHSQLVETAEFRYRLKVASADDRVKLYVPSKNVTLTSKQNLTLECLTSGPSDVNVTWGKYGGYFTSSKTQQKSGRLTITNVQRNDIGTYECKVYPNNNNADINNNINNNNNDDDDSRNEEDDGSSSRGVNQKVVTETVSVMVYDTTVTLSNINEKQEGIYQCFASNLIGSANSAARLILSRSNQVKDQRQNNIEIYNSINNNDNDIEEEWRKKTTPAIVVIVTKDAKYRRWDTIDDMVSYNDRSYVVSNDIMLPGKTYRFRICLFDARRPRPCRFSQESNKLFITDDQQQPIESQHQQQHQQQIKTQHQHQQPIELQHSNVVKPPQPIIVEASSPSCTEILIRWQVPGYDIQDIDGVYSISTNDYDDDDDDDDDDYNYNDDDDDDDVAGSHDYDTDLHYNNDDNGRDDEGDDDDDVNNDYLNDVYDANDDDDDDPKLNESNTYGNNYVKKGLNNKKINGDNNNNNNNNNNPKNNNKNKRRKINGKTRRDRRSVRKGIQHFYIHYAPYEHQTAVQTLKVDSGRSRDVLVAKLKPSTAYLFKMQSVFYDENESDYSKPIVECQLPANHINNEYNNNINNNINNNNNFDYNNNINDNNNRFNYKNEKQTKSTSPKNLQNVASPDFASQSLYVIGGVMSVLVVAAFVAAVAICCYKKKKKNGCNDKNPHLNQSLMHCYQGSHHHHHLIGPNETVCSTHLPSCNGHCTLGGGTVEYCQPMNVEDSVRALPIGSKFQANCTKLPPELTLPHPPHQQFSCQKSLTYSKCTNISNNITDEGVLYDQLTDPEDRNCTTINNNNKNNNINDINNSNFAVCSNINSCSSNGSGSHSHNSSSNNNNNEILLNYTSNNNINNNNNANSACILNFNSFQQQQQVATNQPQPLTSDAYWVLENQSNLNNNINNNNTNTNNINNNNYSNPHSDESVSGESSGGYYVTNHNVATDNHNYPHNNNNNKSLFLQQQQNQQLFLQKPALNTTSESMLENNHHSRKNNPTSPSTRLANPNFNSTNQLTQPFIQPQMYCLTRNNVTNCEKDHDDGNDIMA